MILGYHNSFSNIRLILQTMKYWWKIFQNLSSLIRWIDKGQKTSKHNIEKSLTEHKSYISYRQNVLIGWNLHAYYSLTLL